MHINDETDKIVWIALFLLLGLAVLFILALDANAKTIIDTQYGIMYDGSKIQKIQTEPYVPKTYRANKKETFFIKLFKYPDTLFMLEVNDFEPLVRQGNSYAPGGNITSHDAVLTTLLYKNETVFDINDTQGTNISIFGNEIYDLQFKSLYIENDELVFSITEIDTTTSPYTSSVEKSGIFSILGSNILSLSTIDFILWIFILLLVFYTLHKIYLWQTKNGKKKY